MQHLQLFFLESDSHVYSYSIFENDITNLEIPLRVRVREDYEFPNWEERLLHCFAINKFITRKGEGLVIHTGVQPVVVSTHKSKRERRLQSLHPLSFLNKQMGLGLAKRFKGSLFFFGFLD